MLAVALSAAARADEPSGAVRFREHVQPTLENYCYGCHGYGSSEGGRTLDEFASDQAMLSDIDLWWAVMKKVRAGMMPPAGEDRPSADQRELLCAWIKADVFGIDPADPDPGHVTLRRLNRVEYRNTIRALVGVDYDTDEEFPADDTGYGFDNIGDVLSMSPLLMEKYMTAAEAIVADGVPTVSKVVAEKVHPGRRFRSEDGREGGNRLSFYQPARVAGTIPIDKAGSYRVIVEANIDGYYERELGRCVVTCQFDGEQKFEREYEWRDELPLRDEFTVALAAGKYPISFMLKPLVPEDQKQKHLDYQIRRIRVEGPLDEADWVEPMNYRRFFPAGPPPDSQPQRDQYAREVLRGFATRAFRRPVEEEALERLAALAKGVYDQPGKSFEQGIAQASVAVLSSPRFLFRVEESAPADEGKMFPLVDEYALASRLSYFLWSTMPDQQLLDLASRGELRQNFAAQVERMLADERSQALVENFTGQWLQARDVETNAIDPVAALGFQKEWEELLAKAREMRGAHRAQRRRAEARRRQRDDERPQNSDAADPAGPSDQLARAANARKELEAKQEAEREELFAKFRRFGELREMFSGDVRWAMRRETEMAFEHVMRNDRNVLELLDADYTFLNEKLADYYGIPGVEGNDMRLVTLPADSVRGGLLTQGTMLVVTSNPTRTSPVKRGLFILDNVLGTPAPPPPGAVPPLEASADAITGHEPTLREALELHRSEPLCAGCHARMDPLGLALENFNAIGMWRDTDHGRPIDTSGTLLTGENFENLRELKNVLKKEHRLDFFRCLTEKLLTYALGRGLEYYDEHTVDQIVRQLDREDGRFSVLLTGIVESAPFQRHRATPPHADQQASFDASRNQQGTAP
jgi:hypothetical protein